MDFYRYSQAIAAEGDAQAVRNNIEQFGVFKAEQLDDESEEDRARILAPFHGDFSALVQHEVKQLDIPGTTRRSRNAARANAGHARNEELEGLPRTVVLDGTAEAYTRDEEQRERVKNKFRRIHGGAPLECSSQDATQVLTQVHTQFVFCAHYV